MNWRAIPAWLCRRAPTINGLIVTSNGFEDAPRVISAIFYMSFLIGKCSSRSNVARCFADSLRYRVFHRLDCLLYPKQSLSNRGLWKTGRGGCIWTFTASEALQLGIVSIGDAIEGKVAGEGADEN
jgi:hypothetical protein